MQIDQTMLKRILAMNDESLGALIRQIAAESGIDPATLGINPASIANIRAALGSANDEDLKQLNTMVDAYRERRDR